MAEDGPADWKNYEDFAAGIDINRMPATDKLSGQQFAITLAKNATMSTDFKGKNEMAWTDETDSSERWYEAINVADDVYFIDSTFTRKSQNAPLGRAAPGSGDEWSIMDWGVSSQPIKAFSLEEAPCGSTEFFTSRSRDARTLIVNPRSRRVLSIFFPMYGKKKWKASPWLSRNSSLAADLPNFTDIQPKF